MRKATGLSTFKVAATYIGTVVGAGFASGQEILQFFAVFGNRGFLGLLVVTVLFILFGFIIMELGQKLGSRSHIEIIRHSGGKYLSVVIDFIITFFLFGALTAMIAGSGALFRQQFGIPALWGNLLMAVVTAVTVLTGIRGVINSISFVVPFLLVSALGISIASIFIVQPDPAGIRVAAPASGLIKNWLWAALLYTSYNTVLSIAVLGPLGAEAGKPKPVRNGAIFGGLGLGIGAMAIYFALSKNINSVINVEVPMAFIAGGISYVIQMVYVVVLLAEVYTTAVGSLYGFTARLTDMQGRRAGALILGATAAAFIASRFGFSNLVKYLYPVVGYGGIFLLISLLYGRFKTALQK